MHNRCRATLSRSTHARAAATAVAPGSEHKWQWSLARLGARETKYCIHKKQEPGFILSEGQSLTGRFLGEVTGHFASGSNPALHCISANHWVFVINLRVSDTGTMTSDLPQKQPVSD